MLVRFSRTYPNTSSIQLIQVILNTVMLLHLCFLITFFSQSSLFPFGFLPSYWVFSIVVQVCVWRFVMSFQKLLWGNFKFNELHCCIIKSVNLGLFSFSFLRGILILYILIGDSEQEITCCSKSKFCIFSLIIIICCWNLLIKITPQAGGGVGVQEIIMCNK